MSFLLGIDIGTSGTKTVLFDELGRIVSSSLSEYTMYQPQNGWAEQDPEDWWKAVCESVGEVLNNSGVNPSEIKGIGLSGQMHGAVFLDKEGRVLRRSIIWCDQRTASECVEITEKVGRKRLIEITANPALTGFTASKILWVKNNEPQIYDKVYKILLPKDYIRFKLTGEYATEVSDASGMQLLDVPNRCWSGEVLEKLGIDRDLLGEVFESCYISGKVSGMASEATGLHAGTPVAGGAGDQAACAVGNGIVREGIVSSVIGTSGVVFAHSDKVTIDPEGRVHTFCHAVPGAWHVMGVTQGAGLSLKWFRDNFCEAEMREAEAIKTDPYILMDKKAESSSAGSNGVIYLPYLMGERTPHLDPDCRGVFFGLSAIHTKNDIIRSVMEGVGYSLMDCLSIIKNMGIDVSEVRASGGGGKSPLWRQIQADIFGAEITTVSSSEAGALGAALIAGAGTGIYTNLQQACDICIKSKTKQLPDAGENKKYLQYYDLYKRLYESLKGDFRILAGIS